MRSCNCRNESTIKAEERERLAKMAGEFDETEFYEAAQRYRLAGVENQQNVIAAFDALKDFVVEKDAVLGALREKSAKLLADLNLLAEKDCPYGEGGCHSDKIKQKLWDLISEYEGNNV